MEKQRELEDINNRYSGGENLDLKDILLKNRRLSYTEKLDYFSGFLKMLDSVQGNQYRRMIISPAGTEVEVIDKYDNTIRKMIMFGSNNYLGLANHPLVVEKVKKAINKYGIGIGGPPLLNGYTQLHAELENKLAVLKKKESVMLFSSGYNANVGLVSGLCSDKNDAFIYDEYSHASLYDGIKLAQVPSYAFKHNNTVDLETILRKTSDRLNQFVAVEGVYSMDGDMCPLDEIVKIARRYNAITILDDAHATLVLGDGGSGSAGMFETASCVDITMGTFSKAFAVTGGFVAGSKDLVEYLRYFARSYMFSASLSIPVVATVLACLEVIEAQPDLRIRLIENVGYAKEKLRKFGLVTDPKAAIIALRVPANMDIRKAAHIFIKMEYSLTQLNTLRFQNMNSVLG